MRSIVLAPLLAGLAHALPQANSSCVTVTSEVVVPTTTYTFTSTAVTTIHETTPENLGTFTLVTTISDTTMLETLTSTSTDCTATGTVTVGPVTTVYTASAARAKRNTKRNALALDARDDGCTVTTTFTTTYGATESWVLTTGVTSTYSAYTAFTEATVTSTKTGGKAYIVATATATTEALCGITVNATTSASTSTVTQDSRCAPSALTSAYSGYGLESKTDTPAGGAVWNTATDDASQCCQLCADVDSCAASSWDIGTGQCALEFPVSPTTGELNCGEGLLAYYDAGPTSPMSPGAGLYVQALCGNVEFGAAEPDDGT